METRHAKTAPRAMERTGEYAVSAVRFSALGTLIYKLRVHRVRPGSVYPPLEILRAQLVSALAFGTRFVALCPTDGSAHAATAEIRLVEVEGIQYIRCDAEELPADHLAGVSAF